MSLASNLLRFALSLKLVLAAFIICIFALAYYSSARDEIRAANATRSTSQQLADELRQSSDDLTRMVRTYVVTGDRRYRDYFEEILAIRDGRAPRPQDYEGIYWDLVLDERRPTPAGTAMPLLQRMVEAGFTSEELNRLAVAKQNSDALAAIEQQAMALVEAGTDIASAIPPEVRLQAITMLHDAAYHRGKADIMRPIGEATRMMNARTAAVVNDAERHVQIGLLLFALSGLVLLGILVWTHRNLRAVFGGSVKEVHRAVVAAGADTGSNRLDEKHDSDSLLETLREAQQMRISYEGHQRESKRALSESERRLRDVVGALDSGVCIVQDALIRFVNAKAPHILGLPEGELLDRPFIQFVRADERAALMERYRKRVVGTPVDATHEFHLDNGRRVVSKATECEWSGRPATLIFLSYTQDNGGGAIVA